MKEKPILVFQTDFTYKEGAVSAMYGVVKSVDRSLEIIDGTHEIPQYDIYSASYRLHQVMRFWPKGTVFVSVVDPGVGTKRRACVAKLEEYYIVTPDNGTLTHIAKDYPILEVREIDETVNRLRHKDNEEVSIFHGRDLFGYCAARFASGIISYEEVGPAYDVNEIVKLPIQKPVVEGGCVKGIVEISDPNFGNSWTNIPCQLLLNNGLRYGDPADITITCEDKEVYHKTIPFFKAFGDVAKGEDVLYHNELNNASLAVCMGNFMEKYGVGFGSEWKITIRKGESYE